MKKGWLDRLPGLAWSVSLVLLVVAVAMARWARPDADLAITVFGRASAALALAGVGVLVWRAVVSGAAPSARFFPDNRRSRLELARGMPHIGRQ
jgi:hypothetical protein